MGQPRHLGLRVRAWQHLQQVAASIRENLKAAGVLRELARMAYQAREAAEVAGLEFKAAEAIRSALAIPDLELAVTRTQVDTTPQEVRLTTDGCEFRVNVRTIVLSNGEDRSTARRMEYEEEVLLAVRVRGGSFVAFADLAEMGKILRNESLDGDSQPTVVAGRV